MRYCAVLLTHLETEMDKEWDELTEDDFLEMDRKAYNDLVELIRINKPSGFSFRHYRTMDDMLDDIDGVM